MVKVNKLLQGRRRRIPARTGRRNALPQCGKLRSVIRPVPTSSRLVTKYRWSPFAAIADTPTDDPALGRFIVLSVLVHVFLILLFGSTTGTSSSSFGESSSRPLGVRLRPLSSVTGTGLILAPGIESSLLGAALMRRLAESKEPQSSPKSESAPAPATAPAPAPSRNSRATVTEATPASAPAANPPQQPPPFDAAPALNMSGPEILDRRLRPSSVVPPPDRRPSTPPVERKAAPLPPTPAPPLPPVERVAPKPEPVPTPEIPREVPKAAVPTPPRPIEPPPEPVVREEPVIPAPPVPVVPPVPPVVPPPVQKAPEPPLPPITPPAAQTIPAPPAVQPVPAPPPAPVAAPLPTPTPREAPPTEAPAVPVERAAAIERAPIPRTEAPPTPAPPVPIPMRPAPVPIERATPPRVTPDVVAPPTSAAPREIPVTPAPVERASAPAPSRPAAPAQPATAPAARDMPATAPSATPTATPSSAPASSPSRTPASAPAPAARDTGEGLGPSRNPPGTPGGRDDIFRVRPDAAPSAPLPSGAPRINLDAARQRAREVANEGAGSRGILPLQIAVPMEERKSKLAKDLENAIKPDCDKAYGNMGLLAVPALIAGAVADAGCRWR